MRILLSVFICIMFIAPAYCKLAIQEPRVIISERLSVESSAIRSIGFKNGVLEIEFNSGSIYQYFDIPDAIYSDFMSAESKGRFFHKYIRGRYEVIRIK